MWGRKRTQPIGDAEADRLTAIGFWQSEVHYYEDRAGSQGQSAHRIVTLASGVTAAIPVASGVLPAEPITLESGYRLLLYAVPAVILLLWATAIRLLHEMELLREYRFHAERQIDRLRGDRADFAAYRTWEGLGTSHDAPQPITTTFLVLAAGISSAGLVAVLWSLDPLLDPAWSWLPWALAMIIIVLLAISFTRNSKDAEKLGAALENPPRAQR